MNDLQNIVRSLVFITCDKLGTVLKWKKKEQVVFLTAIILPRGSTQAHVYIYIYTHIHTYVCLYIHLYMCIDTYIYVRYTWVDTVLSITSYSLHPLLQVVFYILANQTSSCSFSSPLFRYQACFIKSTCSHAFLSLFFCSPSTMNISLSPQLWYQFSLSELEQKHFLKGYACQQHSLGMLAQLPTSEFHWQWTVLQWNCWHILYKIKNVTRKGTYADPSLLAVT